MDHNTTIDFNGAELNLSKEYHEARKMMGNKRMDLTSLYSAVSHVYLCIPGEHTEWVHAYLGLMEEIQMRETMLLGVKLDKLLTG